MPGWEPFQGFPSTSSSCVDRSSHLWESKIVNRAFFGFSSCSSLGRRWATLINFLRLIFLLHICEQAICSRTLPSQILNLYYRRLAMPSKKAEIRKKFKGRLKAKPAFLDTADGSVRFPVFNFILSGI